MAPFNRLILVMTRPWVILAYVLMITVLFLYVDKPLADYLAFLNFRVNFIFLNFFTKLGLGILYMTSLLLAALFFRYKRNSLWEARMWFLWLCVVLSGIACGILKVLLGRARPDMWFHGKYYGFYWLQAKAPFWSFPSGHTTTVMAIAFGLCVLFPRYFYIFILSGFSIAISRVLLVHHYFSDVLTATYLALLVVGLLLWFLRKKSWLEPAWRDTLY
ncbi:phosphoesterase, PA-phosphatase related [Legionella beliardensis]|uniref:undecaprenyl-diphosphate phosphatase n=1 Tax=Legionella beliardensis TaxID=91822 RepID=A0A378HZ99_9GAMM|nr:phosphatase PAP2 family protein [Legionella beliardensis]STX28237.1 phosphoesterase, PA-phosphatase related [Legionella beliardensis]